MKKLIAITVFASLILGAVFTAPIFIDSAIKSKIEGKITESLEQNISFDEMDVHHFDDRISFKNVKLSGVSGLSKKANFKAEDVELHVDFKDALSRNFQVERITATGVTLNFNYSGKGQSNYLDMQQNFRAFIKSVKEKSTEKNTSWDIYNISLINLNVNIYDSELGEIGSFHIPDISLPPISSMYSKESNKDILLATVGKNIISHMMKGTLVGDYNKVKLATFVKRELMNEAGKATGTLREKMMNKAKELALKLSAQ